MNTLYHLSPDQEIVSESNGSSAASQAEQSPVMLRDTAFAMVARTAQQALPFHELLNEAALLTASALEAEFFGYAEVRNCKSIDVSWGSVADTTRNVEPVPVEVPWRATQSAFAMALESSQPTVLEDTATEKRFRDSLLTGHQIRAGVICPISFRNEPFGAIGVLDRRTRAMERSEISFVQSIAILLGPTRAHQKTERLLAEHSRFLSSAIDSLDAMVVMLNMEGTVTQINRTCLSMSGFTVNELRGQKMSRVFFSPEETDEVERNLCHLLHQGGQIRSEASFTTKSGTTRRVNWTFTRLPSGTEDATILATGVDVTEQFRALSKLGTLEALRPVSPVSAIPQELELMPELNRMEPCAASQPGSERRAHDRRPFTCVQSIAPCIDGKLPERGQFRVVRCHDISPRGFSFLLASPPQFDELVAAFGSAQSRLFLRSRVVHSTTLRHDGRNVVLVGCEYIGRVRLPWTSGTVDAVTGGCSSFV